MMTTTPDLVEFDRIEIDPDIPNIRSNLGELSDLEASIYENGVLTPLHVWGRPGDEGKVHYFLVSGWRRYTVVKRLREIEPEDERFKEVPVVILEGGDLDDALIVNLTENLQREDLSPLDLSDRISFLRDERKMDTNKISGSIGKSPTYVRTMLRFRKAASKEVLAAVEDRSMSLYMAERIVSGTNTPKEQAAAVETVKEEKSKAEGVEGSRKAVRALGVPGFKLPQHIRDYLKAMPSAVTFLETCIYAQHQPVFFNRLVKQLGGRPKVDARELAAMVPKKGVKNGRKKKSTKAAPNTPKAKSNSKPAAKKAATKKKTAAKKTTRASTNGRARGRGRRAASAAA